MWSSEPEISITNELVYITTIDTQLTTRATPGLSFLNGTVPSSIVQNHLVMVKKIAEFGQSTECVGLTILLDPLSGTDPCKEDHKGLVIPSFRHIIKNPTDCSWITC